MVVVVGVGGAGAAGAAGETAARSELPVRDASFEWTSLEGQRRKGDQEKTWTLGGERETRREPSRFPGRRSSCCRCWQQQQQQQQQRKKKKRMAEEAGRGATIFVECEQN